MTKAESVMDGLRRTRHTCLYVHGWETEEGGRGSRCIMTRSGARRWRDLCREELGMSCR